MSIEAVGAVLQSEIGMPPAAKMVLIGLANHAGPTGDNAFPAIATLATYAEISERSVKRYLQELQGAGLIELVEKAKHHRPTEYRVRLDRLPTRGANPAPQPSTARGDTGVEPGVTPVSTRGDTHVTQNRHEPSLEPTAPDGAAADAAEVEILTPHKAMFEAICVVFGYDWRTLPADKRGAINRQVHQLLEAGLDPLDLPAYVDWLLHDHRSPLVAGRRLTVSSLAKWLPDWSSARELIVANETDDRADRALALITEARGEPA